MKAVILAAGVGRRLRGAHDGPKCLLEIGGETLLHRYLRELAANGISDVALVVGYRAAEIEDYLEENPAPLPVRTFYNPAFTEGSLLSFWAARDAMQGSLLLMDADVYFESEVLRRLVSSSADNVFVMDTTHRPDGEAYLVGANDGRIVSIGRDLRPEYECFGEWVGFAKFSEAVVRLLLKNAEIAIRDGKRQMAYEELIPALFPFVSIAIEQVDGCQWEEIDFAEDLVRAQRLAESNDD